MEIAQPILIILIVIGVTIFGAILVVLLTKFLCGDFQKCEHDFTECSNGSNKTIYCKKCGKINIVPHECIWEKKADINDEDSKADVIGYTLQCKICGDMKTHYIGD